MEDTLGKLGKADKTGRRTTALSLRKHVRNVKLVEKWKVRNVLLYKCWKLAAQIFQGISETTARGKTRPL
jgi:hypothetical protein